MRAPRGRRVWLALAMVPLSGIIAWIVAAAVSGPGGVPEALYVTRNLELLRTLPRPAGVRVVDVYSTPTHRPTNGWVENSVPPDAWQTTQAMDSTIALDCRRVAKLYSSRLARGTWRLVVFPRDATVGSATATWRKGRAMIALVCSSDGLLVSADYGGEH